MVMFCVGQVDFLDKMIIEEWCTIMLQILWNNTPQILNAEFFLLLSHCALPIYNFFKISFFLSWIYSSKTSLVNYLKSYFGVCVCVTGSHYCICSSQTFLLKNLTGCQQDCISFFQTCYVRGKIILS